MRKTSGYGTGSGTWRMDSQNILVSRERLLRDYRRLLKADCVLSCWIAQKLVLRIFSIWSIYSAFAKLSAYPLFGYQTGGAAVDMFLPYPFSHDAQSSVFPQY